MFASDLVLHPCLLFQYMDVSTCYRILSQIALVDHPRISRLPEAIWNQRHTCQTSFAIYNLAGEISFETDNTKVM